MSAFSLFRHQFSFKKNRLIGFDSRLGDHHGGGGGGGEH